MIGALAKAGRAMERSDYIEAARRAAEFLEKNLMESNGRLLVRWRDGEAAGEGKVNDYAFTAWGLMELYQSTLDLRYLELTVRLMEIMTEQFWDSNDGGFYIAAGRRALIHRPKEVAVRRRNPSGNSVACNGSKLAFEGTGEIKWGAAYKKQFAYLAGEIQNYPAGYCFFALLAMLRRLTPSQQLVICTAEDNFCVSEFAKYVKGDNITILLKTQKNSKS